MSLIRGTKKLYLLGAVFLFIANDPALAQFGFTSAPNVTNPALPRVLLIGDSIMAGYKSKVRQLLDGQANIDDFGTPLWLTNGVAAQVQTIVNDHGPYDVIHFNDSGLHGWQEGRPPANDHAYQDLLQGYVDVLKTSTERIIWANTTNLTASDNTLQLDPVNNPTIIGFNTNADIVMAANGIATIDLYGITVSHLNWKTDQFHWNSSGYTAMASAIAPVISAALTALPGDYNGDSVVDAADYTTWRDNLGATESVLPAGTGDNSGVVDAGDYTRWKVNFGASNATTAAFDSIVVPEPNLIASLVCLAIAMSGFAHRFNASLE
jgi:hypothetical protein